MLSITVRSLKTTSYALNRLNKNNIQGFRHLSAGRENQIVIDGQTINYLRTFGGRKSVLCFPGALGTIWSDFKPQIDGLGRKYDLVAWDPPGYGKSMPPAREFTQNFYRDDARMACKLMKALKIDRFSLLGWSDGGISSMILCAEKPNCIEKLIIWGSNAYVLPEEIVGYEKIRDLSKWSDKMKAPLIATYGESELKRIWDSWCDTMAEMAKQGGDFCKASLPKIRCPTLILHGAKDPMIASEHPKYLLENIPSSKLHVFPEGKHNIHLRYAEEFNRIVGKFLAE